MTDIRRLRRGGGHQARTRRATGLGASDPRWDRDARKQTLGEDFGEGLEIKSDRHGRAKWSVKAAKQVSLPNDAPTWAVELLQAMKDAGLMEK